MHQLGPYKLGSTPRPFWEQLEKRRQQFPWVPLATDRRRMSVSGALRNCQRWRSHRWISILLSGLFLCSIPDKLVSLQIKVDEDGRAVHESCYILLTVERCRRGQLIDCSWSKTGEDGNPQLGKLAEPVRASIPESHSRVHPSIYSGLVDKAENC